MVWQWNRINSGWWYIIFFGFSLTHFPTTHKILYGCVCVCVCLEKPLVILTHTNALKKGGIMQRKFRSEHISSQIRLPSSFISACVYAITPRNHYVSEINFIHIYAIIKAHFSWDFSRCHLFIWWLRHILSTIFFSNVHLFKKKKK